MKKALCASLAGIMLFGFASCDSSKTDVSDTEAVATLISNETTTTETREYEINASLEDVRNRIKEFCNPSTDDFEQADFPDTVSANKAIGIKDYHFLSWLGDWKPEKGDQYFMDIEIAIIEFDMESDTYKNLKAGDKIVFYLADTPAENCIVSAINGQYVLCMTGVTDLDKETPYEENMPDFTIANLQEIYLAFMEME